MQWTESNELRIVMTVKMLHDNEKIITQEQLYNEWDNLSCEDAIHIITDKKLFMPEKWNCLVESGRCTYGMFALGWEVYELFDLCKTLVAHCGTEVLVVRREVL